MKVVVTGGAGYIGSHTTLALLEAGHSVIVVDNFANSSPTALARVQELTGQPVSIFEKDIRDFEFLRRLFTVEKPDAVVHFAALKSVGDSNTAPLAYYDNNVSGSVNLFRAMSATDVRTLIFSSSATVYGSSDSGPIQETAALEALNPYGRTKLMVEEILRDLAAADPSWSVGILRYFNPVGAHPSGRIGEDPVGVPSNLLPYVGRVAAGRYPQVTVLGDDYPTRDGTGIRDYIHVMDLAEGHISALSYVSGRAGSHEWNLGTGKGYSVLEIIRTYSDVAQRAVPYVVAERRKGDTASSIADPAKASRELNWAATRDLVDMVRDHWRWQVEYPNGYREN